MKHQIKDNYIIAKPFVKWAGGKGSLISQLIENLPQDFARQPNVTYIEPFVGGGAMLFYMLIAIRIEKFYFIYIQFVCLCLVKNPQI